GSQVCVQLPHCPASSARRAVATPPVSSRGSPPGRTRISRLPRPFLHNLFRCCERLKRWQAAAVAGATIRDGKELQHSLRLRKSTTPKRTPPSRRHRRQRGQRGQSHPERPPCAATTTGAADRSRR